MQWICTVALIFTFVPQAAAQQATAPFKLQEGEHVRVRLSDARDAVVCGRVRLVEPDSVQLGLVGPSTTVILAWRDVSMIERRVENRTAEVVGLLLGGLAGGLAGYALGETLSDDPLAGLALIPGAFGGMLIGGVVGAHTQRPWQPVPRTGSLVGFRAVVPLR